MNQKLDDALAFSNYRLTLQSQRQNIEARTAAALLISFQGAIFQVTQQLISFVDVKIRSGSILLVEDQSGNVIDISDASGFAIALNDAYDSAMKLKQAAQQKLKSARSTAKIVGL